MSKKRRNSKKTSVKVIETTILPKEKVVVETKTKEPVIASFLEPQIVSPKHKDFLAVFDENGRQYNKTDHFIAGKYNLRWKNRKIVNTGREGIFAVMPKDHPEFKGKVFVLRDDAPGDNFFQYEDLVLCVCRRESLDSQRVNIRLRNKQALEGSKADVREGIERIVKETKPGNVSQIRPLG